MNFDAFDLNLDQLESNLMNCLRPLLESLTQALEKIKEQEKDLAYYSAELTKAHKKNTFLEYELKSRAGISLKDENEETATQEKTGEDEKSEELEEPPTPPSKSETKEEDEGSKTSDDETQALKIKELEQQIVELKQKNEILVQALEEVKHFLQNVPEA